jgi:SsrA-binding protein
MAKGDRVVTVNRRAYHDYHILESLEAGLVLTGTEIKSVRAGKVSIREAHARPEGGELWLVGSHIAAYESGSHYNHEPGRPRKLLLHRDQIGRLSGMATQKGLTLVPLRVYIKNGVAKVELGVARGKKVYDKREAIARRDADRELRRAVKLKHR